jgi:K+-sensing histidine kinase KdpD
MSRQSTRRRSRQTLKALSKRESLALKKQEREAQSKAARSENERERLRYRLECLTALQQTLKTSSLFRYWEEQERIAREDERFLRARLKREWQSRSKPARVC